MDFNAIPPGDVLLAYNWHSGFAAANQNLLPRTEAQFRQFVLDGQVWAARDERGYAGFIYCVPERNAGGAAESWELGGLMVASREKGQGIGWILASLALIDLLISENPLSRGERIIAHVLASNREPQKLLEKTLKFTRRDSVFIPGHRLPGLPVNSDGCVEGEVYEFCDITAIQCLADWCIKAPSQLKDGRQVSITLPRGYTLQNCAVTLRALASERA
jgi:hypothetical protein